MIEIIPEDVLRRFAPTQGYVLIRFKPNVAGSTQGLLHLPPSVVERATWRIGQIIGIGTRVPTKRGWSDHLLVRHDWVVFDRIFGTILFQDPSRNLEYRVLSVDQIAAVLDGYDGDGSEWPALG